MPTQRRPLPPAVDALVREVAVALTPSPCDREAEHDNVEDGKDMELRAFELLHFLAFKAAMSPPDTGVIYRFSPPPKLDHDWHALILETDVYAKVSAALGTFVHHSRRLQPSDGRFRMAHIQRLCDTVSMALTTRHAVLPLHKSWHLGYLKSGVCVEVRLLPVFDGGPLFMVLQGPGSTVAQLQEAVRRVAGVEATRFRLQPAEVPFHPQCSMLDLGASFDEVGPLRVYATVTADAVDRRVVRRVTGDASASDLMSLRFDGRDLDSIVPGAAVYTLEDEMRDSVKFFSFWEADAAGVPQKSVDDSRPLRNFMGGHLVTKLVPPPFATVRVTLAFAGKRYTLDAEAHLKGDWTVADLQAWGGATTLGPTQAWNVILDGKAAPLDYSWSTWRATDAVSLQLSNQDLDAGMIAVAVKTLTGKQLLLWVHSGDDCKELKELIHGREGVPECQQRLIYAGKQMEDDSSLSSLGVKGGSVVHLVLWLTGC